MDEVFAEYDRRGKITNRVIAGGADEQSRSAEISFSGGLAGMDEAFSEAEKAVEAIAASSWTTVIYFSEDELIFIAVQVAGQKRLCILQIERKNGEAISDLVLIPYLGMDGGEVFSLCAPTEWVGPVAKLGITTTAKIYEFSKEHPLEQNVDVVWPVLALRLQATAIVTPQQANAIDEDHCVQLQMGACHEARGEED